MPIFMIRFNQNHKKGVASMRHDESTAFAPCEHCGDINCSYCIHLLDEQIYYDQTAEVVFNAEFPDQC